MEYEQQLSKLRKLAVSKLRRENLRDLRLALDHHFADNNTQGASDSNQTGDRKI
jgi:hypothetical protein